MLTRKAHTEPIRPPVGYFRKAEEYITDMLAHGWSPSAIHKAALRLRREHFPDVRMWDESDPTNRG